MKVLLTLILLIAVGAGVYWFFTADADRSAQEIGNEIRSGAGRLGEAVEEQIRGLDAETIKEEMLRTGRVVRQRAGELGAAVKDVTADARITAAIQAKFVADADLSPFQISVNTTDGLVTLSGTVNSHEALAKAIRLALETDGVREVASTLQAPIE